MRRVTAWFMLLTIAFSAARGDELGDLENALAKPVIGAGTTTRELQDYLEGRIPRMPKPSTPEEWNKTIGDLRRRTLEDVIFRGAARQWRTAAAGVERFEQLPGTAGYRVTKLRYEILPGMCAPALLYEPEGLNGRVPVSLAVNGHEPKGKAADYKQIRCINMAKRGMIVLNVEWLGMGQLRAPGFRHYAMNQLDLCGTSGIAPFYLAMSRALDLLLSHPNADAQRVAVSGLSGGGWQTIFISALDPRVTLANPVAGYSSFRTRVRHFKDLGDSEQTPCDLATVVDYTHLTAMLAPRPSLLTYNSKDNCCFESGYALPPLLDAARPAFKTLGAEASLRTHVNDDPGDHNFGKDNRQALYRFINDHFFKNQAGTKADEIACDGELKSAEQLEVPLPKVNADFNSLAREMMQQLPRTPELPPDRAAALAWQRTGRAELTRIIRDSPMNAAGLKLLGAPGESAKDARYWRCKVADRWSLPVVELVPANPKATTVLIGDAGRAKLTEQARALLAAGHRVLAVDLIWFGESAPHSHAALFALLHAAVGERPLGLQASQLSALARWACAEFKIRAVEVHAVGPRSSVIALATAANESQAINSVTLTGSLGSLKELIEQNRLVDAAPELFCFGLLERFDIRQLIALVAPRPVRIATPGDRAIKELGGLSSWYQLLGTKFDPLMP